MVSKLAVFIAFLWAYMNFNQAPPQKYPPALWLHAFKKEAHFNFHVSAFRVGWPEYQTFSDFLILLSSGLESWTLHAALMLADGSNILIHTDY